MAYPAIATLTGTVTYSDGVTLLDGYVLLLIAFPTGYSAASIANQLIPQFIGSTIKVRIQQGVYDQSARIYQNPSLEPIGTAYAAAFYDNNDVLLGTVQPFVIATSPYHIAVPGLPLPNTGTLSWTGMTDAQWTSMTDAQWTTMGN